MQSIVLTNVRRIGRYDWLGGYTPFLVMDDGGVIGPECIRSCFRDISYATRHHMADGWEVIGIDHTGNTDEDVICDHCGCTIV